MAPTQILLALPRASAVKISATINQGIEPEVNTSVGSNLEVITLKLVNSDVVKQ